MADDITRERYPCNWPKGAHAFGVLSDKEVAAGVAGRAGP